MIVKVKDDAEAGDVPSPSSSASTLSRFTVVPLLQSDQAGKGPGLAVIMSSLLKPTTLCEVVIVVVCVQAGVTAAIATSASEAAKGGRGFVLRPNNDAEVFKLCTKDAVQLQPKSMIRLC